MNNVYEFNEDLEKLIGKTITNFKCNVKRNSENDPPCIRYQHENFVLEFDDGYFFIGFDSSPSCCEETSSWSIELEDQKKLIGTTIKSLYITGDTDDVGYGGEISLELNGEEVFSFSNEHNGYYSHCVVFEKKLNSESVLFQISL